MSEAPRLPVTVWRDFGCALFRAAGVHEANARKITEGFLEADLLGFHTHGFALLPLNLRWIREGMTRVSGEPSVLSGRGAVLNADAAYLAGPLAMGWAALGGI